MMILYRILRLIVFIIFRPLFRIRVRGYENLPKEGGYIICANHKSNWDPLFLAISIRRPIKFMAKKELFENGFLKVLLKALGAFPVDREGRDLKSLKNSIKLLKDENILGIFPEGTRTKNIARENMKEGVAYIGLKAKSDIVPIEIISTFKPLRKTYININEVIKIDEYQNLKSKEAMVDITDRIYKGIYKEKLQALEKK